MTTTTSIATTEAHQPHRPMRRRRRPGDRAITTLWQLLTGLVILTIWHLTTTYIVVPDLLRATPAEVFSFLASSIADGVLGPNLWSTLEAALIGFVLASTVGIIVGIGLALLPTLEKVLRPYLNALNSMPRIALGPLLIVFFGIGQAPKIALAFTLVFFILMMNAAAGIQSADKDVLDLMKAHNCSKLQLFRKVLLPVAMPSIVAGLRLGLIYALLGVITAEMISSEIGIGQLILYYSQTFEIAGVYAMLIVLAVVATALDLAMGRLEARMFRWRPPTTGRQT